MKKGYLLNVIKLRIAKNKILEEQLEHIEFNKYENTASRLNALECKIDFHSDQDMAYTRPIKCNCGEIRIDTVKNWTELYTALLFVLWNKNRSNLSYYIGKNLIGGSRPDICSGAMSSNMKAPKLIEKDINGNSIYLETNLSAKDIVGRIKRILEICHISLTDVEITYIKKDDTKPRMVAKTKDSSESVRSTVSSDDYIEWLVRICGLADVTAKHYDSSVRRAEEIAKEQGLASQRLFTADSCDEAQETYSELLKNSKFVSMNESAHNGFTAAIKKYLQYLLSGATKSHTSMSQPIRPRHGKELVERCLDVLSESFSNGIKRDAEIAKRKFRNAYANRYESDLPVDIDLDDLFRENALEYDGKFYAINTELIDFLQKQLQVYPIGSDMLFFYDTFYDKNISQFSRYGIYSAQMMRSVLEKEFPDYSYRSNCFSARKGLSLEQVVTAAYGEDTFLTISELQERLPYIAEKQLLSLLRRSSSGFVRVTGSTYAMENRVYIAKSDVERSKQIIEGDIRKQGHSFVKSVIVEESEAQNPEMPEQTLQLILFDRYMVDYFSRNRNLILPLGESDNMVNVLKNFCRQHKKITLKEVEEYEMEFAGEDTARRSLRVVSDAMIRVSDDTFVAQINFDVSATDKAIEPFFNNRKVISLKNVTSFSAFPDVEEYAWNSYLLASYLRLHSEQWGYIGEEHRKKSVGAIFDKLLTFDSYDDAMAQAVADSGTELTQEDVGYFLVHNEYRLRNADFKDIISKAYQIRMREE